MIAVLGTPKRGNELEVSYLVDPKAGEAMGSGRIILTISRTSNRGRNQKYPRNRGISK